jgi:hypothetical protein
MGIDYSRIRSLTARETIAALAHDGFYFVRQKDLISGTATRTDGVSQRRRTAEGIPSPSKP